LQHIEAQSVAVHQIETISISISDVLVVALILSCFQA